MDIQQLIQLIKDTPNDAELGRKLREWLNINDLDITKKYYINPYNGKVESK
jgi:hypothetical protein